MSLKPTDLFVVQRPTASSAEANDAGTYKIQASALASFAGNADAVIFKGSANFTDDQAIPANPKNGDMWINTVGGTWAWGNSFPSGDVAVQEGDKAIYAAATGDGNDQDDPNNRPATWFLFEGEGQGGGGTLTGIDVVSPITKDDETNPARPSIGIQTATQDQAGATQLATQAIVATNGSGGGGLAATGAQLRATNIAVAALQTDKIGAIDVANPTVPTSWQEDAELPNKVKSDTYNTPAASASTAAATDSAPKTTTISVLFATEDQVGVNYLAPCEGNNADMSGEFAGAETFKKQGESTVTLGGNLDNRGAMTTKRVYNNFVPRDFSLLNDLSDLPENNAE